MEFESSLASQSVSDFCGTHSRIAHGMHDATLSINVLETIWYVGMDSGETVLDLPL